MRYFIDCEFYEDGKTVDLISIALVAEDGREFYAVSTEARLDLVSPWVREHVLPSLPLYGSKEWMPREKIKNRLYRFVEGYGGTPDPPIVWGYYADYDWVCLCQLFGTMVQLPTHFPRLCYDLKQLSVDVGNPKNPPKPVGEHNALVDARWNRDLYAFLVAHKASLLGGAP
jgi:hypothetical protein